MVPSTTCHCGAKHSGHICMLKSKGLNEEVAHLTDQPSVVCFTCGVEANSGEYVCQPMPIEHIH